MKFTLSWLKRFLDTTASLEKILDKLTIIGLEVEEVTDKSKGLSDFKVAEIIEAIPHPNADKLRVCKVNNGKEILQIVCGAANAKANIKVVLAEVGALIPNGNFKIKSSEIRGIKSEGMLCSEEELFLSAESEGIIELPNEAIIGDNFLKYLNLDDPIIEITVTPNRGDCLGIYGIARDLAAAGLGNLKPIIKTDIPIAFQSNFKGEILDLKLSSLFILREFSNIKNTESPAWLKALLKNVGLKPQSAIVDITNYISYSYGRPLHAYDKDKLSSKLSVRNAVKGEKIKALNGKEYELEGKDIIIADEKEVQAIAGIIGSESSACSLNTQSIILDSALFDKINISKTGRRLHIDTDARFRFERHVDPNFTLLGLELASQMIIEICGGQCSETLIYGNQNYSNNVINFEYDNIMLKTGIEIAENETDSILEKLGFKILSKTVNSVSLMIPSWRADINIQEDIVEEVVRIYGYDKLPLVPLPSMNNVKTRLLSQKQRRIRDAKRILTSRGINEVISWSFMPSDKAELFDPIREELKIANPIASNLDYMRSSIIPNLLEIIAKNRARSFHDLAFFETGPIFKGMELSDEKQVITVIRAGNIVNKDIYNNTPREMDIYDVKADLELLLEEFGFNISKFQLTTNKPNYFHPNRAASLKLGNKIVAYFGEIHPLIIENFDIKGRAIAFELFLDELPETRSKFGKKEQYISSDFQAVERDFAFIMQVDTQVGEIIGFISGINKNFIKAVKIFDIFTGENLGKDKKSVALNVLLQANDKTLTEAELQDICAQIINEVEQKFNAQLRI